MISQGQKMKMQQKLTPQQLLLMRLLQVPTTVLEQTIKQEIERNPLLEDEHYNEDSSTERIDDGSDRSDNNSTSDEEDFESREIDPFEESNYNYDEDDDYSYREHQEKDHNVENHELPISSEASFTEHLMEQFNMKDLSNEELLIGNEIIGSIDDAGYLTRDTSLIANDLAFKQGLDATEEDVLKVLRIVQTLDPVGVGARSLQECLAIQLHNASDNTTETQLAVKIIDNYFEEFSKRHFDRILTRLNISQEQLTSAIDRIKRPNPKPGSSFAETSGETHYIIPDFIVTRDEDNLSFTLNDHNLPELHRSQYYTDMLQQMSRIATPTKGDRETMQFIKGKAESARWFIEMLNQRRTTLQKTMMAILTYQHQYFLTGLSTDLRPMKLKNIAEAAGYDISTISRVVNQKYVQTEFGTFLLKELFTKSFTTDEGESVSTDAIKHYLQEAVDNEDKRSPLTDQALMELLNEKGYPLARRTVAKYRESLGILVGRLRKE